MTGLYSTHTAYGWWLSHIEDRSWTFRCCEVCHNTKPCLLTDEATVLLYPRDHVAFTQHIQGGEMEKIISVIYHVTKHKYKLLLYLTRLNLKNVLPLGFSLMNTF